MSDGIRPGRKVANPERYDAPGTNELQRGVDDLIGRIVRRETDADGWVRVRADSINGEVVVGQTVYAYHADGSLPLVVTEVADGWITAEISLAWRLNPPGSMSH